MITFDSIHETFVTFNAEENLEAGAVCKVTDSGTVGPCENGEAFHGVARTVRCGLAGVVLSGFCQLPYTGATPNLGRSALCADGSGGVKAGGDKAYLVVDVDTVGKTVSLFL